VSNILIKNVRIPSLSKRRLESCDLLFVQGEKNEKGKILEISKRITDNASRIIDGEGDFILPAFIDLSADIHHPDNPERETVMGGSLSAFSGGYSDLLVKSKGDEGIEDSYSYCKLHICSDKNDKNVPYVYAKGLNIRELRDFMKESAENGSVIFLSPEPDPLYHNSCVTEGRTSSLLGLPCEPVLAEIRRIFDCLTLADERDARIHISGISCAGSVELIRRAKADGIKVTASTSPVYFSLKDDDIFFIGPNAKVYPPLRGESDRLAVIEGIKDGTIDCIDSGHTPRTQKEKGRSIIEAQYGAIGLQSCFSAVVTYLLLPGHIDIFRLCELLYLAPARILGLKASENLDKDCRAFNLASISTEFIFSKSYLKGKSTNSPFINMSLCGNIRETFIL